MNLERQISEAYKQERNNKELQKTEQYSEFIKNHEELMEMIQVTINAISLPTAHEFLFRSHTLKSRVNNLVYAVNELNRYTESKLED